MDDPDGGGKACLPRNKTEAKNDNSKESRRNPKPTTNPNAKSKTNLIGANRSHEPECRYVKTYTSNH